MSGCDLDLAFDQGSVQICFFLFVFILKYIQKYVFVSVFATFKICAVILAFVFDHCIYVYLIKYISNTQIQILFLVSYTPLMLLKLLKLSAKIIKSLLYSFIIILSHFKVLITK